MFLTLFIFTEWRQEELERINNTLTGAERKAALCMLLDQETQLISAIGRHKIESDTENKDKRIQDFLDKVRVISRNNYIVTCADPESFFRGVQLSYFFFFFFLVDYGKKDTNTTKSGPSLAHQQNSILRFAGGPMVALH